jgi:hypothetical protein
VDEIWDMAQQDPHLKRLGNWLANKEGKEEMTRRELEGVNKKMLEARFLMRSKEPGNNRPTIVKVVNPEMMTKPFVLVWDNRAQDHKNCPLFQYISAMKQKIQEDSCETQPKINVPGLSEGEEIAELPQYKSWEKWERKKRICRKFLSER